MKPDEIRNLAIECGFNAPDFKTSNTYVCLPDELAAYTAAVEARERERCSAVVDHILKEGGGTYGDAIREMK